MTGDNFQDRPPHPREDHTVPELRGLSVLLIEDNPVNRALSVERLRRMGLSPAAVATAKAAVDSLRLTKGFRCILCDLNLPDFSGPDLLRMLRDQSEVPVPVVAFTGQPKSDRKRLLEAGFDEFIAKPVSDHDLAAVLLKVIRGSSDSPRSP